RWMVNLSFGKRRLFIAAGVAGGLAIAVPAEAADYRATDSGDWTDLSIWKVKDDGSYVAADELPGGGDMVETQWNSISVNTTTETLNRLQIRGGTMTVEAGNTLNVGRVDWVGQSYGRIHVYGT